MMIGLLAASIPLCATSAQTPLPIAIDWKTAPVAPGVWSLIRGPGFSEARFTPASPSIAWLSLRCDLVTRQIRLSRGGPSVGTPLLVLTTTSNQVLQLVRGSPQSITNAIAANDPLLDAIAFSRGRFAVSQGGAAMLIVPAWPEPARAIEDCRK